MMKIKLLSVVFVVILFTSCDVSVDILNSENSSEYSHINLPEIEGGITRPSYGFLSGRWWQEDTDRGFNNEYELYVSLPDSFGIAKFLFKLKDKSFSKKTTYTSGYIDLNGSIRTKDNYNDDIRILRTYNRYPDRDPNEKKWRIDFLPPNEETQFNNLRFLHLKKSMSTCCDLKYSLYHNQMGSRMRKLENDGKYIEDWKFETFDPSMLLEYDKKFDKKKVYSVWEDE